MKKLIPIVIMLVPILVFAGFWDFLYTPSENLSGGSGTITQLPAWKSTSTPNSGLTQRVFGQNVIISGLDSGLLQVDSDGLVSVGGTLADGFSTTSATYFVHSSTTIPKTYTENTFTNTNSFNFGTTTFVNAVWTGNASGTAENLFVGHISSSTRATVQDMNTGFHSTGQVSGGEFIENPDFSVTIQGGYGYIRATNSATSSLLSFDWSATTSPVINNLETKYFGITYNSGSPYVEIADSDIWDNQTGFMLGIVTRDDSELHTTIHRQSVGDHAGKMITRMHETMHIQRDEETGGLVLGETGTRNITMSAGALWLGLDRYAVSAIDTSASDNFDRWYRDGSGGWTKQNNQTQWDNTQYDDGSGTLATLNSSKFSVQFFWIEIDGDILSVYGQQQHSNFSSALDESVPASLPPRVENDHSKLIGRIIFETDALTASQIDTAFTTNFGVSSVTEHGNLSGLTDDDHTQYWNNTRGNAYIHASTTIPKTYRENSFTNGTTTVVNLHATGNLQVDGYLFAPVTIVTSGDTTINGTLTAENFIATSTLTASTFPYASSTALTVSGNTYLGTLNGLLKGTSGLVSVAVADTDYQTPLTFGGGLQEFMNAVDCNTADGIVFGCLSPNDWNAFNNKEEVLTFGDGLTRTANDIDCDTASGTVFGCLASADWTTFNNKLSTSLAKGYFFVGDDSGVVQATSSIFISSTGFIGIGDATPSHELEVNGITQSTNGGTVGDPTGDLGDGARYSMSTVDTNPYAIGLGAVDGTKYPMWFQTGDVNGGGFEWYIGTSERMRIDKDGNVGIGTTTPGAKLEVDGGVSNLGRIKVTGGASGYTQADILLQSGTGDNPQARGLGIYAFNEGTDANWYFGNPYSTADSFSINRKAGTSFDMSTVETANSLLTISSAGNMGVGTTGPTHRLEVKASVNNEYAMQIYNGGGDGQGLLINAGSGTNGQPIFRVNDYNNATSWFTINEGGNVGIGTTSPVSALAVQGAGTTFLTVSGASTGYVNSGIRLWSTNGTNGRGGGTFMYDQGSGTEWFSGRPYSSSDNFIIARKTTALLDGSTAQMGNALLTVTSAGNVGIGTTTPNTALHTYSNSYVGATLQRSTGDGSLLEFKNYGVTTRYNWFVGGNYNTANAFEIIPSTVAGGDVIGSTLLTVLQTGNVGIGDTSPSQKLDVEGIIQADNNSTLADPTGDLGDGARFSLNDSTVNPFAIGLGAVDGTKYPMWFQTGDSNGGGFEWYIGTTEAMRISKEGNLGVNVVPSASAKVDIQGATNSIWSLRSFIADKTVSSSETNTFLAITADMTKADIDSGITDSGSRNGLRVEGYISDTDFQGTLANQYAVFARHGINVAGASGARTVTNSFGVYIDTLTGAGTVTNSYGIYQEEATIKNYFAGNVGVATTSPWRKLSVTGTVGFSSTLSAESGSDNYLCIDPLTYEVTNGGTNCGASSRKYKENINPLLYGLKDVLKMEPVSFDFKETKKHSVGFIAEEMVNIIPEVVEMKDGEPESIEYDKLTAVLVNAIKEQNKKIESLEARIKSLEK